MMQNDMNVNLCFAHNLHQMHVAQVTACKQALQSSHFTAVSIAAKLHN